MSIRNLTTNNLKSTQDLNVNSINAESMIIDNLTADTIVANISVTAPAIIGTVSVNSPVIVGAVSVSSPAIIASVSVNGPSIVGDILTTLIQSPGVRLDINTFDTMQVIADVDLELLSAGIVECNAGSDALFIGQDVTIRGSTTTEIHCDSGAIAMQDPVIYNNAVVGYVPSEYDHFEEVVELNAPFDTVQNVYVGPVTADFRFRRSGNQVTVTCGFVSGTTVGVPGASFLKDTPLPARFRSSTNTLFHMCATDIPGFTQVGRIEIHTNGDVEFFIDQTGAPFIGAVVNTFQTWSVSYMV